MWYLCRIIPIIKYKSMKISKLLLLDALFTVPLLEQGDVLLDVANLLHSGLIMLEFNLLYVVIKKNNNTA